MADIRYDPHEIIPLLVYRLLNGGEGRLRIAGRDVGEDLQQSLPIAGLLGNPCFGIRGWPDERAEVASTSAELEAVVAKSRLSGSHVLRRRHQDGLRRLRMVPILGAQATEGLEEPV